VLIPTGVRQDRCDTARYLQKATQASGPQEQAGFGRTPRTMMAGCVLINQVPPSINKKILATDKLRMGPYMLYTRLEHHMDVCPGLWRGSVPLLDVRPRRERWK
jgi:hypothetical protein